MSTTKTAEQIADELLKAKIDQKVGELKKAGSDPTVAKKEAVKIDPRIQSPKIKEKHYYDVKVECMLPATLTFRVLAEEPEQALDLIRGMSPTSVKHRLLGRKDTKVSVYEAGTSMLKWMKNLLGG